MRYLVAIIACLLMFAQVSEAKNPPSQLLDRLQKGASRSFVFELSDASAPEDYFEISLRGAKIKIVGNNWLSVAVGLKYYLSEVAGIYVGGRTTSIELPKKMPRPEFAAGSKKIRRSTSLLNRYSGSLLSQSYSTAFWSAAQWQQHVDYLALCGVTMPLVSVGLSEVWGEALLRSGVSRDSIQKIIPHPAFEGLWLSGEKDIRGFTTPEYALERGDMGAELLEMCKAWGMSPVLVGYDHEVYPAGGENLKEKYYQALTQKYGVAEYYYVPAPEDDENGVAKAQKIFDDIDAINPLGQWVVSAWEGSPTTQMIDFLPRNRVILIDSWAEVAPQWGDKNSEWYRREGFVGHRWLFGISGEFAPTSGMYGALRRMVDGFQLAQQGGASLTMQGVGSLSGVLGENDVVQDLLYSLPWIAQGDFALAQWLDNYVTVRYGEENLMAKEAWRILNNTVYDAPRDLAQRGASESVFAAVPALRVPRITPHGTTKPYYDPQETEMALELLNDSELWGNENFERDVARLALLTLSNYGYELLSEYERAFDVGNKEIMEQNSNIFLEAMLLADNLLNSHSEDMAGVWINSAMASGNNPWERDWLRAGVKELILARNIMVGGVMERLCATRWARFFQYVETNENLPLNYDYSDIEQEWLVDDYAYPIKPTYSVQESVGAVLEFLRLSRENQKIVAEMDSVEK